MCVEGLGVGMIYSPSLLTKEPCGNLRPWKKGVEKHSSPFDSRSKCQDRELKITKHYFFACRCTTADTAIHNGVIDGKNEFSLNTIYR